MFQRFQRFHGPSIFGGAACKSPATFEIANGLMVVASLGTGVEIIDQMNYGMGRPALNGKIIVLFVEHMTIQSKPEFDVIFFTHLESNCSTAVDRKTGASDKCRGVRRQEYSGVADFFRRTNAFHRSAIEDFLLTSWIGRHDVTEHL